MKRLMDLTGRKALVTGGSGDIGAAISIALAKLGAEVIVHTFQNLKAAKHVVEKIEKLGQNAKLLQANLLNREDTFRMSDEIISMGSPDILVNNAGTPIKRVPWQDLDEEILDQVFALNYRAPLYLTQKLTPGMIERGKGVIINILSGAAHNCGTETVFAYGSAKSALMTLTRGLARSLAPKGIRVLSVSPGTVDTNIQRNLTSQELLEQLVKGIPIGRIGRPEEIGDIVGFMATDKASFIVGETIEVNGGVLMI